MLLVYLLLLLLLLLLQELLLQTCFPIVLRGITRFLGLLVAELLLRIRVRQHGRLQGSHRQPTNSYFIRRNGLLLL